MEPVHSGVEEFSLRVGQVDPLFAALRRLLRTPPRVAFTVGLAHLAVWIAVGVIIGATYPTKQFHGLLSFEELPWTLFVVGILVPTIWGYYVWLPDGIASMVQKLCSNNVIDCSETQEVQQASDVSDAPVPVLIDRLTKTVARPVWTWLALGGAVVVVAAIYIIALPVQLRERGPAFFAVTWWSKAILQLINAACAYVILQIAVRAATSALELKRFFNRSELRNLYVLHPDNSGGMGAVGQFAMHLAFFAVVIGFWAAFATLLPVIAGGRPNFSVPVLAVYGLYIFLTPFIMSAIIWPAHGAMKRFKRHTQEALSTEIQEAIRRMLGSVDADAKVTAQALERVKDLREVYRVIEEMPEWPIHLPALKRFSGFAMLPGLLGTVSFAVDILEIWPLLGFR